MMIDGDKYDDEMQDIEELGTWSGRGVWSTD